MADVTYSRQFVPLINDPDLTGAVLEAAARVFKPGGIKGDRAPITASEDFARFLDHVPGTFGFIGNGEASLPLHNSGFDFNDEALPFGMHYHVAVARQRLPVP